MNSESDSDVNPYYECEDLDEYDLDEDDLVSFSKSEIPLPIELPARSCCCLCEKYANGLSIIREDPISYHKRAIKCMHLSLEQNSPECQINTLRNATITELYIKVESLLDFGCSVHFADVFLRMRHEILFRRMCKVLSIESERSDQRFSDLLPISSDRTPDWIHIDQMNVNIIEVTVTTNLDKAAKSKGIESMGYFSKYKPEIDDLKALGYNVSYHVIVFDAIDINEQNYKMDLRNLCTIFNKEFNKVELSYLETLRKEFCKLSRLFYNNFSDCLSKLFNKDLIIKNDVTEEIRRVLTKPASYFEGRYNIINISTVLFDTVLRNWNRLIRVLDNFYDDEDTSIKSQPIYDHSVSRFDFRKSPGGLSYGEWVDCLVNDNKALFCRYLKIYYKSEELKDRKSGYEFFSYDSEPSGNRKITHIMREGSDPIVYPHQNSFIITQTDDITCNHDKYVQEDYLKLCSDFEDHDYDRKLIEMYCSLSSKFDSKEDINCWANNNKMDILANKVLDDDMIDRAIKNYNEELDSVNRKTLGESINLTYCKTPTIYPINITYPDSYSSINQKPKILEDFLLKSDFGDYTNKILQVCSRPGFGWGSRPRETDPEIQEIKEKIKSLQGESLSRQKIASVGQSRIIKLKEIDGGGSISLELSKLYSRLRSLKKERGGDKELPVIRLRTSGSSIMKTSFHNEMRHFKQKDQRSAYKGVGLSLDFNSIRKSFNNLSNYLLSPSPTKCVDEIYDENMGNDIPLLESLKRDYLNDYQSYYNWLKSTNLYHACAFVSRVCHTLLFFSQASLSSSYVAIDNLGYSDCILICKGGKKIFPTKRSKLFRIFYPVSKPYFELMFPQGFESSSSHLVHQGRIYVMSPWMLWHETHLTDGLCFLSKMMGFCLLSRDPERDHFLNARSCLFNVILAFHARRQTESSLHNLRYIMANCLGDLTAVDDMLKEFAGFNYDCIQFYLRGCISVNFKKYYDSCKKLVVRVTKEGWENAISNCNLPHIFTEQSLGKSDDFSRLIYSTYLMPKAPITQSLEQVSNLKSMLETHALFKKQSDDDVVKRGGMNYITLNNTKSYDEYQMRMFESDFNFDPSYMIQLGKFMSDYLVDKFNKSEMSIAWDKILSRSWDTMANSSGLRGSGDDFFGKKGYYVVYDDILNDGKIDKLLEILKEDVIDEKKIKKLNETYLDKIGKEDLNTIVFHVVDKVQRGGKREIFVMDKMTKVHQQPIEAMMAEISKKCPSEMISIPSNKRLHTIHSRVFESKHDVQNQSFFWVMDCRKWAPRSMLEKFIYFLSGMREILPPTFVKHCYNFFMLMLKKQVHTRPHILDIIKKSEANKWIDLSWMIADNDKKSVYYNMTYSWMMGIFNYFSSLIHVANQLHAAHVIQTVNMVTHRDFVTLTPIAHSDDSAAKFSSPSMMCTQRSVAIYEMLLKSANHLLSKKKCNIGRVYFEFISVLYLGSQLLPLLPKFLGQFNFQPTDGGYCTDINDAYSKCINLIQNGATFQQAYLSMKIQSMLVWRFYFGYGRKMNYDLPTQLYGTMDAHPIMVLFSGSDSDILRLYKTKGEKYLNKLSMINEYINPNKELGISLFHPITASPDIRLSSTLKKHYKQIPEDFHEKIDWSLTNVNFENTAMNTLQYLLKLRNKSFCASMQDDTLSRRISRSYFFRESAVINTNVGKMKQSSLINLITSAINSDRIDFLEALGIERPEDLSLEIMMECEHKRVFSKVVNLIYSELMRLLDYWSKMSYNDKNLYNQKKTTKPIHISLQKTIEGLNTKFEPSNLSSWIKEDKYRNLLVQSQGYKYAASELEEILGDFEIKIDDVDVGTIFHILNKLKSKSVSNIYCYGNVPSGLREINTYQDVTLYLSHNSFESKYIKGLTLPLGRTINIAAQTLMPDLKNEEVQHTCAVLNIIISSKCTLANEAFLDFIQLDVDCPDYLSIDQNCGGKSEFVKIIDYPNILLRYWVKNKRISNYFMVMIELAEKCVRCERISGDLLENSYYYSFLKRQFLVIDQWMGKGKILVGLGREKLVIEVDGNRVKNMVVRSTTMELDKMQINYLNFVLQSCEINTLNDSMIETTTEDLDKMRFGLGLDGTYKISYARGLLKCLPSLSIDPNLTTRLANLSIFRVKIKRRMKLELESSDELYGENRFILNLFIVDPEKSLEVGRNMMKRSLNNERILMKWNKDEESYMIDLLSQCLDIDLYVHHDEIYNHFEYTKLYKIMNHVQNRELATISGVRPRQNVYPAQEGGLLDILIKYQIDTRDIDFNWNRVMTPELMSLKSSQPEAFMASLIDNLDQKYHSLYNMEDREQMFKELSEIMAMVNDDSREQHLMKALTMWGFVGVSGSISQMSKLQLKANYQIFRDYGYDFVLLSEFAECFIFFLKSLFECYIDNFVIFGQYFQPLLDTSYYTHQHDKIKELLISLITSISCFLYKPDRSRHLFITASDIIIYEMLLTVSLSHELKADLLGRFSKNYLLCQIPIDHESIHELFRTYRSLMDCYCKHHKLEEPLSSGQKVNRVNVKIPSVVAKELASKVGVDFNVRKVFYNGLIPVKLYDRLNRSYQKVRNGKHTRIALKVMSYEDITEVNFHPAYCFKGRLDNDFVESEYFEELNFELNMAEPDIENIESNIEEYGEDIYKKDSILKIPINGHLTEHYKVPVLDYLGKNLDDGYCKKYLQAGNDVVIITNSFYIPLIMSELKFNVFKFKCRDWHDKALLFPDHIFIIVVTKHLRDVNLWCEILDADIIDKDWIGRLAFQYKLTTGRSKDNELIDDYNVIYGDVSENDALLEKQLNWSSGEVTEIDDLNKSVQPSHEVETEESKLKKILIENGIDEESADKFVRVKMSDKVKGSKNVENIFNEVFSKIISNKDGFDKILNCQNNVISAPLTEDQVTKIFQVPGIFGKKLNRESTVRNNALKDKELVAEIDSLTGEQTSRLISGMLTITPKMFARARTCISMGRKLVAITQKDKSKKTFLLDFFTLFLNDAKLATDSKSDEKWADAIAIINTYLDWDDDELEGPINVYTNKPTKGRVGYVMHGDNKH